MLSWSALPSVHRALIRSFLVAITTACSMRPTSHRSHPRTPASSILPPKTQQTLSRPQHSRWDQASSQQPQASTSCLDPLHVPAIFSSFDVAEAHSTNACHPMNLCPFLLFYSRGSTPSVPVTIPYSHSHQRHFSAAPTRLASQANQLRGSYVARLCIRRSASVCSWSNGMPWPKVRVCFIPFNRVLVTNVFFIVCIKFCGRPRPRSQGQRYPRRLPSTLTTRLRRSHPHIWQPFTRQVRLVLSRSSS